MLGNQTIVAFVAVTDGDAAHKFYEGTLGLKVLSDDGFALVCQAKNATLRLQKIALLHPQMFTVLGWEVDDVAKKVDELGEKGVKFERYAGLDQDPRGIWTAPGGSQIAWFKDPFGNTLSLSK
jgi:catechol 2,3-dioxygenase-like lactoylglutathione lyase family enzyme